MPLSLSWIVSNSGMILTRCEKNYLPAKILLIRFYRRVEGKHVENLNHFKLLLLSIYSIAAQQINLQKILVDGQARIPPGQHYFEQAKLLLSE